MILRLLFLCPKWETWFDLGITCFLSSGLLRIFAHPVTYSLYSTIWLRPTSHEAVGRIVKCRIKFKILHLPEFEVLIPSPPPHCANTPHAQALRGMLRADTKCVHAQGKGGAVVAIASCIRRFRCKKRWFPHYPPSRPQAVHWEQAGQRH